MGWLLKIIIKKNHKFLIFFNFIKIGYMNTGSAIHKGTSLVLGIWRIEMQFNISFIQSVRKVQTKYKIKDIPHA
tara:strand:- start:1919 stop:2140 length:222 start_codon:yes stop_codon:yes gene_type:complete